MQILKLDFVPLSYMWFVVAVENALSTLKALLKRNNLFKAGRIVQKISYLFLSKLLWIRRKKKSVRLIVLITHTY